VKDKGPGKKQKQERKQERVKRAGVNVYRDMYGNTCALWLRYNASDFDKASMTRNMKYIETAI